MGICFGRDRSDGTSTARRNTLIEASIEKDKQRIGAEVKLLLLGAGESGKSTVLKQMKVIHEGGYSRAERLSFRFTIYSNILDSAQRLCEERQKRGLAWTDRDLSEEERTILDTDPMSFAQSTPAELLACVQQIYQDPVIKQLIERGSTEFYLLESTKQYASGWVDVSFIFSYFDQLDIIAQTDWIPSDQDILRSRVKTTGITEILFKIGRLELQVHSIDNIVFLTHPGCLMSGGQRSERKKWKNCFDGVTAIIFMVAISEYDQICWRIRVQTGCGNPWLSSPQSSIIDHLSTLQSSSSSTRLTYSNPNLPHPQLNHSSRIILVVLFTMQDANTSSPSSFT